MCTRRDLLRFLITQQVGKFKNAVGVSSALPNEMFDGFSANLTAGLQRFQLQNRQDNETQVQSHCYHDDYMGELQPLRLVICRLETAGK